MSRFDSSYEPRVRAARAALENDAVLAEILSPDVSPLLLECFVVEWLARFPYLTEPATRWVAQAAEACGKRGMKRVGMALGEFARREAEDEVRVDLRNLRAFLRAFNLEYGIRLEAEALLAEKPTVAMRAYRILHEEVLATDLGAAEIAIAYEMERASSIFGLALLLSVQRVLGPEAALRLSGLRRRAPHGVERTAFFGRALDELLGALPEAREQIAELGAGALDIYRHFLRECVEAARGRARLMQGLALRNGPPSSEAHA